MISSVIIREVLKSNMALSMILLNILAADEIKLLSPISIKGIILKMNICHCFLQEERIVWDYLVKIQQMMKQLPE